MAIACDLDRSKVKAPKINAAEEQMVRAFFEYNKQRNLYIQQQSWPNYYEWLKENRFNGVDSATMFANLNPQWNK